MYAIRSYYEDSVEKPVFLITGNHDLFFDGWKTFYEFFGSSTYYFTVSTPEVPDLYRNNFV